MRSQPSASNTASAAPSIAESANYYLVIAAELSAAADEP